MGKGNGGARMAKIGPPNHPISVFDSTSSEVQLQLFVPGISLGAKFKSGNINILISYT
jgi:hypothetical protein